MKIKRPYRIFYLAPRFFMISGLLLQLASIYQDYKATKKKDDR